MFVVGLTGGIATGKSTVSKIITERGLKVVDADQVAREVVEPGQKAFKKIVSTFGPRVLDTSGSLDRAALGEIIFTDASARQKLNAITHPEIYKSIFWKCLYFLITGHHYVILDLPLLFESGKMVPFLRHIIVVTCTEEQQRSRLMSRNGYSASEAEVRISSQMSLGKKCELADMIVDNSGNFEETKEQVHKLMDKLDGSKAHWKLRLVLLSALLGLICLGRGLAGLFM